MKKFYISILSLILCTSTVPALAKTPSREDIASMITKKLSINDCSSLNKLSLKELLDKLGLCENGNITLPDIEGENRPGNDVTPEIKPDDDSVQDSIPEENKTYELRVLELVNEERVSRGLTPLTLSDELSSVAQAHSADMAKRNYFSHNSPEGLTPFDRIKNAGISYKSAGENIAAGQKTPEDVVESWMNSDGHRKNILNSSYREMGIGIAYGGSYGIYWTQLFKS